MPDTILTLCRQGFPDAQRALEGPTTPRAGGTFYELGWFGTRVSDERGSFALVDPEGPLSDLVGDVVRFRYGERSALAYVVGSADIPYTVGTSRRVFAALALLAMPSLQVTVEVVS